jgi:arylamine N-acetyltransferase
MNSSGFFQRYNVRGSAPCLFLLREISRAFSHLPYENVTKILKESRSANSLEKLRQPGEVVEDHLRWNTGGTCFSLCNTLLEILQQSGFECYIAMGDMHYGANIHCAVVAMVNHQPYLLDPGYLLHDPIAIPTSVVEVVHPTPMNTVVLKAESEQSLSLYTVESGVRKWRYRLRLTSTPREEFQHHWIHSFSLNSMENLLLSRINENGRIYFRKNTLELVNPAARKRRKMNDLQQQELGEIFNLPADMIRQAQQILLATAR